MKIYFGFQLLSSNFCARLVAVGTA